MTLSGALDRIDIAYAPATGISGIKFYRAGNSRAIGNIENEVKSWQISTSEPIVGLYGYQSARGIEGLSLVTLDVACQGNDESKGTDRPYPIPEEEEPSNDGNE